MKILSLEEYGLRCMLRLAKLEKGGPVSISRIAKEEGMSLEYVSKLMHKLRLAKLVKGVRGINGGFALMRAPEKISLAEIMTALSGSLFEEEFCSQHTGNQKECVHLTECGVRPVWRTIARHIFSVVSATTLAMLMEEEKTVESELQQKLEKQTAGPVQYVC